MKKYLFLLILFLNIGCSNNNGVYWCGDHPCINKKEKEAYFKKTMIVEQRKFDKSKIKKDSEIEKLLKQAKLNEQERILSEKELKKISKIEEKELAKQIKLEEKRRVNEEKELAKQIKIDEKKKIKKQKKLSKKKEEKKSEIPEEKLVKADKKKIFKSKQFPVESTNQGEEISLNQFDDLVKMILKRNNSRPYPDINDIPK